MPEEVDSLEQEGSPPPETMYQHMHDQPQPIEVPNTTNDCTATPDLDEQQDFQRPVRDRRPPLPFQYSTMSTPDPFCMSVAGQTQHRGENYAPSPLPGLQCMSPYQPFHQQHMGHQMPPVR